MQREARTGGPGSHAREERTGRRSYGGRQHTVWRALDLQISVDLRSTAPASSESVRQAPPQQTMARQISPHRIRCARTIPDVRSHALCCTHAFLQLHREYGSQCACAQKKRRTAADQTSRQTSRPAMTGSYKRVKGRSHTPRGKTKSQSSTQTPCNQPAIAILTHTQTQHRLSTQLA